jgi:hypothetical protein
MNDGGNGDGILFVFALYSGSGFDVFGDVFYKRF